MSDRGNAMSGSSNAQRLRWGILGGGNIAKQFGTALATSAKGTLVSVATRSALPSPPAEFDRARMVTGYDKLLADVDVNAVYIGLPHPFHAQWAIRAVEAGKHVLCEKPIAINVAEANEIFDAADRADRLVMEAFMYRAQRQSRTLIELLQTDRIGTPRFISSTFDYHRPFDPAGRQFANELGGGAIMDVGCYPVSLARLVAGVAAGKPYAEPAVLHAVGKIGSARTDEEAAALMQFDDGFSAVVVTCTSLPQGYGARIVGTLGTIEIPSPWFCQGKQGGTSEIVVTPLDGPSEHIVVDDDRGLFAVEADVFADSLARGEVIWPAMSQEDTLGNMATLDRWRQAIGVRYDAEEPSTFSDHPGTALNPTT